MSTTTERVTITDALLLLAALTAGESTTMTSARLFAASVDAHPEDRGVIIGHGQKAITYHAQHLRHVAEGLERDRFDGASTLVRCLDKVIEQAARFDCWFGGDLLDSRALLAYALSL